MKAQHLRITLPPEIADQVERKVRSGAYASPDEVVREGVLALLDRDEGIERWLRDEVVAGHEEFLADPSKGIPAELVLETIRAKRAKPAQG